jgi:hypothetical protein
LRETYSRKTEHPGVRDNAFTTGSCFTKRMAREIVSDPFARQLFALKVMKHSFLWVALFSCVPMFSVSCSDDEVGAGPPEDIGRTRQAIAGGCQTTTYGSPCDPDGVGPLTECQGICRPDPSTPSGQMACFAISAVGIGNLDGRICGDDTTCSSVSARSARRRLRWTGRPAGLRTPTTSAPARARAARASSSPRTKGVRTAAPVNRVARSIRARPPTSPRA